MTVRRVLYPSLFIALAPSAAAAPAVFATSSVEPIVVFQNSVVADSPTPPTPPTVVVAPVFSQSPDKPAPRGFPAKLAQDGSDFVPFPAAAAPFFVAPSVQPFVVQTSTVLADSPNPPQPITAVVQPYGAFPQDPIKVSYGFPVKLMQDGSETSPTQPAVAPPVFAQSPERFLKGFPAKLAQDGSDFTPFGAVVFYGGAFGQYPDVFWKANPRVQWTRDDFPASVVISVTPQGFWTQFPALFVKPYPAAQQRFQDLAPFTPPVVVQYGAFPQYPDLFWKATYPAFRQQDGSDFTSFGSIVYPPVFSQSPERFAKGYPSYLAPYGGGASPFPPFVPVQYGAFPQYPDIFVKGFPVKLQWARDDFPASTIVVPPPQFIGAYVQDPVLFGKPFPATQQRFGDFAAAGTIVSITPQGWWGRWPDQFAKPYPVSLQHPIGFAPAGDLVSTPQGWWGQSPVLFWRATYPASRQQDGSDFTPFGTVTMPGGYQFQWPDLFIKPFAAKLQWARDDFPASFIAPFTPTFVFAQSPDLFRAPVAVKLQWQGDDFPAQGTIVSTTPQGWMFQSPERFIKPLSAAQQRFPDFAPAGFILVIPPFIQTPYFQYPDIFAKKFPAAQQRFADFTPAGTIISITPQGWWGQSPELFWKARAPAFLHPPGGAGVEIAPARFTQQFTQWPERFIKPLSAAQQRFQDFTPLGTIVSATPQGWWGQSPVAFKKPIPVSLQIFAQPFAPRGAIVAAAPPVAQFYSQIITFVERRVLAYQFSQYVLTPPTVATPSFFPWSFAPVRHVRPLKASEQMWSGWTPFLPPIPPFVALLRGAYDPPVLFIKPFPAAQQQFEGFAPFGTVFEILTAEGMKNEIIRVRWLEGQSTRIRYLKNEVERTRALPTKFSAILPFTPPSGWMSGESAWTVSVRKVTYKVWLMPYSSYLN